MKEELKAWCQHHHCEALAQLAVFGPAREALKRDASVVPALEAVAEVGLSAETREVAAAALMALSDKELEIKAEGQKHVMLSCASTMLLLCSALFSLQQLTHRCMVRRCRPMGCASHDHESQRVADRSRLHHVV